VKVVNLQIEKIKSGMKVFEDVFNLSGLVILYRNSLITEENITKLIINNIERVKVVFEESETSIYHLNDYYSNEKIEAFKRTYAKKVEEITVVLKTIGRGEYIDLTDVKDISKGIISQFDILGDILNFMHLVRPLDDYTFSHSLNVSIIGVIIGIWLDFTPADLDELATAGLLHDVGKTRIPEAILAKPSKLNKEEFEEMKKHTIFGYKMVENIRGVTDNIRYSVIMHHEKIDGSGYPFGLKESEIPLFPKILAIADIYDAMTSNRSYRDKMCPFEVIKNFEMQTFGKLDSRALTTFLRNIASSYKGDFVRLSNGEIGEVIFINPNRVWQPIVRVNETYYDLSKNKDISIEGIV